MESNQLSKELQSIVEAIRSSDVVENRVQLVEKLGDLEISDKHDLGYLVESLTTFWEDFTCLDITQCMLNKTILHIASKYLNPEISGCLLKFIALGNKAATWCRKHLKMTIMPTEESQEEEHSNLYFQLLLNLNSFSATSFTALTKDPIADDKASTDLLQDFILEQLNLTKDSILEIKRIGSFGPEVLKSAQVVIDGVVRMCGAYFETMNSELDSDKSNNGINSMDSEWPDKQFINITKSTIEKLCDLGIIAANDGGSLVSILNVSWKGVVTLLQLGKGVLAEKVSVSDIVLTLISLVNESMRCAAEAWSSPNETISVTEARRTFLPVKFYLVNAVKISSLYPCQTYVIFREISHCVLKISMLKILLTNELLKTAGEVLADLVEQTSFDLLRSLLNSAQLTHETKSEILDWLFMYKSPTYSVQGHLCNNMSTSMSEVFSISSDALPEAKSLLLGRVSLFLCFLRYSLDLEEEIRLGIARKLDWFLEILIDEEVYSFILVLQVPLSYGSKRAAELVWQPMFSNVLHALKTFMIVASSSLAWGELESFLLENLFHPHYLCCEIVVELWCFLVRHAEVYMANGIVDQFCSLLMLVSSPKSDLSPGSVMRKIARMICMFLAYGTQSMVDRVYNSIVGDNTHQISSAVFAVLLMEGFPLNMLSDNLRSIAKQKIINEYFCFIERFDDKSLRACNSTIFEVPVYALSASLQSIQISFSDVNLKTLKFLVAVTHSYKNCTDKRTKGNCRNLLSETLSIISNMKHLYESDEMKEVVLELQNMFISGSSASDTLLYQCKPNLAAFLAGLAQMEMAETNESAKSFAVWELYHMILRERHWAFVHLAIAAFGYFAARSNCDQLWRFVPQNAALSYDLVTGNVESVDRFMSELKTFLEKETALLTIAQSSEQFGLLIKEGRMLRENAKKISDNYVGGESMEIDDDENRANKRRKLPDGISKGMELLQSGLKVIDNGLSHQMDSTEFHQKFLSHFSDLKDVIANLEGLAGDC